MPPIRVGFLGLSSSGWAPGAHLPFLKHSDKYQIVAICNSSVESSKAAIKKYELPENTRAYGDPEELAKDKDVDLVVCSVRVDRHLATVSPSLRAGKNVFVEWPLGKNLAEAKELLRLKNEGGVKTAVVGLQARQSPVVRKLKQLVDDGRVGKVLSSTWTGQGGNLGPTVQEGYAYLSQREVGGNLVSIHFGHSIDYIQAVLGYGFTPAPKTLLASRRSHQKLLSSSNELIKEEHPVTSDDTIFLHGSLTTGVPLAFSLRGGKPFKDVPGLDWRIYGETGEIRVTSSGPFLNVGYPDVKISISDFDLYGGDSKDTVTVEVEKDEFDGDSWGLPSKNVARIYRDLAEGRVNCSFEDAVEGHELIDEMYKENGIVF
ncbi:transcription regulator gal80 [Cadophora gregata]|uniref:transcription regulator gal80 n=1 Tax=Cadophora gregata TaxID=51156 RepID=UPI0026DDBA8F|nr:transcription regulator gal80 [Cadophora gregata]KAK0119923.1 transcription regulator gal80 [Cadophora gregata]KAK0120955.1 transcription regulator gal80 [Cadophora gregata f. sp. sojae]